jgi:hypothetical protein
MLGRFVAITGGLFLALVGWAWLRAETPSTTLSSSATSPDGYFAVDVSSAKTAIDLPGNLDGTCDLIVSSLGDPDQTFRVTLSNETEPAHTPAALREIAPLQWTRYQPTAPATAFPSSLEPHASSLKARDFHLHVTDTALEDPRGYTRVDARLATEGRNIRVYCDVQIKPAELAAGLIDEIVRLLDERIIPRSREFLGTHSDVDGDGKLAVLLTPWLGHLQGGRTSVNGFVRSSDFHPGGIAPYSNRGDVLYLNSALRPGPELAALLAHEYTHAVCCSLRQFSPRRSYGFPDEADWLNEAIAHVAERLHETGWSNLDRRVQSFLEKPHETPLVVRDYYRAGLWRDPACRGATYLFLQWCADGFGKELLHELAVNPQTGIENLETVTGRPFATLYRHWTIALHQSALPSLDLQSQLGGCQLAGPHRHFWSATDGPLELKLRGTATAFVRCTTPKSNNQRNCVVIEAPPHARLQVTIAGDTSAERPTPTSFPSSAWERTSRSSASPADPIRQTSATIEQ